MSSNVITRGIAPAFILGGLLTASVAQAANFTGDTVGVINTNERTVLEATGNSLTAATFATNVATAFSNNTGGVWNFENLTTTVLHNETITLNYGASLANSLQMTLTLADTSGFNAGIDGATTSLAFNEPTSGITVLGLPGNFSARTFTLSEGSYLLTVGILSTDRNDASRIPSLTVTFLDNTTASTSGANADNVFFHGLSGTLDNPIVSFTLTQNNYLRWDDLGFIVAIPEPSSAVALAGVAAVGFAALRRRRAHR